MLASLAAKRISMLMLAKHHCVYYSLSESLAWLQLCIVCVNEQCE